MISPSIVIPIYTRLQSLKRLLWSIEKAKIPHNTRLVFRYHKGATEAVIKYIENYKWINGEKRIIHDEERIDLDENLRRCGDLSLEYDSIIILEDDSLVSPYFYDFAIKALEFYGVNQNIAQISLYNYTKNSISGLPFSTINQQYDAFAIQKTSTRGQLFTKKQWSNFRNWLAQKNIVEVFTPSYIQKFGHENWEFQHNQYLIDQGLYSIWPQISLSSNQGKTGTHHPNNIDAGFFQVPLQNHLFEYKFVSLEDCYKYDAYFELEPEHYTALAQKHNISLEDFTIDLQGFKPISYGGKYWLTSKPCKNAIATFSDELKPIELNILWENAGTEISLCKVDNLIKNVKTDHYKNARRYFAENTDVGLWNYLRYKWLKYVERKKLNK
ncbi:MAG: hypothetical protein JXQ87_04960 [Bacteroidia bacterium]